MDIKDIENCINQIKPYCDYVYLHILGEPLLHPGFNEILNILDYKNMKLQLVTNGVLLHKYPDILNHSCLRKLSISLHSINSIEVNESYFDTINELIENNNDKNIELRFYNKQQLDTKLNNYLDFLKIKYSYNETSKTNSYKIKDNVYIYYSNLFKWPDINDEIISDIGTCHGAVDMLAINVKGEVTICCLDPKAHNSLGNLKDNTLKEIIESDRYKTIINDFKNKKINLELCKRCSYRLRFD